MPSVLAPASLPAGLLSSINQAPGGASHLGGTFRLQAPGLQSATRTPASLGHYWCPVGGSHREAKASFAETRQSLCAAIGHVKRGVCSANTTLLTENWRAQRNQSASRFLISAPQGGKNCRKKGQYVRCQASDRLYNAQVVGEPNSSDEVISGRGACVQKVCLVCGVSKPLRNFGSLKSSADNRQDLCRACNAKCLAEQSNRELHHLAISVTEAWAQARLCPQCEQVQEVRDFGRNVRGKDGLQRACRSCSSEELKRLPHRPPADMARCSKCKQEKPGSAFFSDGRRRNGLAGYCKECQSVVQRVYTATSKMSEKVPRRDKMCPKCKKIKLPNEFTVNYASRDGLNSQCKECTAKQHLFRKSKRRNKSSKAFGSPDADQLQSGRAALHSTMESEI